MSTPSELFVSQDVEVYFGRTAALELFDYLHPRLEAVNQYAADQFAGEFAGDVMSISDLSDALYNQAYGWILEAADKSEWVEPYKNDLKTALEADPRFKRN